jgi:hypothetical protein
MDENGDSESHCSECSVLGGWCLHLHSLAPEGRGEGEGWALPLSRCLANRGDKG